MSEIIAIMKKGCDWQLNNLDRTSIPGNGWIRGAFFTGAMATYNATKDNKYLNAALVWVEESNWQPGPHPRIADDQCV
jgi:unsaturated rhamnogalacturonyl hydrolase